MSFRQVFRYRNFTLLCLTRSINWTALMIESIAVGWQVYILARETHSIEQSSFLVGMIGLAQFVPFFILSPFAGEMADRLDRRKIFLTGVSCELLCNAALAALALQAHPPLVLIFIIAATHNAVRAFLGPASTAMMPMLVPPEIVPKAVAWSSVSMQFGRIIGPWLGGVLCAVSIFSAYATCTACFAIGWILTFFINADTKPKNTGGTGSRFEMIREGLTYLWANKLVFGAISLDLIAVFLGGATALLPVYARDILHIGAEGFGLLRSATALGGIITLGILAFRPFTRRVGLWMIGSVAVFGVTTIIFGISNLFWLSMLMLAFLGAADSISVFVRQTLVQVTVPDEFRGRVASVSYIFIGASNELGEFESGVAARFLGPVGAVLFGGIGSILASGLWAKLFPTLRKADRLEAPKL